MAIPPHMASRLQKAYIEEASQVYPEADKLLKKSTEELEALRTTFDAGSPVVRAIDQILSNQTSDDMYEHRSQRQKDHK